MSTDLNDPHMEKPETAAYEALNLARGLGLDARQTSANITEAVLEAAWRNARRMYGHEEVDHDDCNSGACNRCILGDIAIALGRPRLIEEVPSP